MSDKNVKLAAIAHGPKCWPWDCVCELQMNWEQTIEALEILKGNQDVRSDGEDD